MPFPMRIQPIDYRESPVQDDAVFKPPVLKSRLKRIFDRPFNNVLRISSTDRQVAGEFEPNSICLDKMVRNFIEQNSSEKHSGGPKFGRNRCNCFNGNSNDSSDDEFDFFSDSLSANSSFSDPSDTLKSLIPCASVTERNLLADTSKIVEENKSCKRTNELRNIVTDRLISLGYNASICRSKWDKSSAIPAGEYEYIDVIIESERLIIDVDFRSEFEIARSTSTYKAILLCLPYIFVGKPDRLLQIVSVAGEAARHSLKKKGMHVAPWRKAEYMKAKWLRPHKRIVPPAVRLTNLHENDAVEEANRSVEQEVMKVLESEVGELNLIFGESTSPSLESDSADIKSPAKLTPVVTWQLPPVRVKSFERGNKGMVTGLASLLNEKP